MNQKQWGPAAWSMLHSLADRASKSGSSEDKVKLLRMVRDLPYMLPCKYCRNHSKVFYRDHDIRTRLENGESPRKILNELHMHVNKRLGKPPKKSLNRVVPGDAPKFLLSIAYNYPLQNACRSRMQRVTRFVNCALSMKGKENIKQTSNRSCLVKALKSKGSQYRRYADQVKSWKVKNK